MQPWETLTAETSGRQGGVTATNSKAQASQEMQNSSFLPEGTFHTLPTTL